MLLPQASRLRPLPILDQRHRLRVVRPTLAADLSRPRSRGHAHNLLGLLHGGRSGRRSLPSSASAAGAPAHRPGHPDGQHRARAEHFGARNPLRSASQASGCPSGILLRILLLLRWRRARAFIASRASRRILLLLLLLRLLGLGRSGLLQELQEALSRPGDLPSDGGEGQGPGILKRVNVPPHTGVIEVLNQANGRKPGIRVLLAVGVSEEGHGLQLEPLFGEGAETLQQAILRSRCAAAATGEPNEGHEHRRFRWEALVEPDRFHSLQVADAGLPLRFGLLQQLDGIVQLAEEDHRDRELGRQVCGGLERLEGLEEGERAQHKLGLLVHVGREEAGHRRRVEGAGLEPRQRREVFRRLEQGFPRQKLHGFPDGQRLHHSLEEGAVHRRVLAALGLNEELPQH
mmetsp:Transcript_3663/g.8334  ORF Transcript_3663/g.8334 Transcript_3663/m.8334 type:complete len:403 (-) Transcript_3663:1137-2345(-)